MDLTPLRLIERAIAALPLMKYALGVAALAAVVTIIRNVLRLPLLDALVGSAIIVLLMMLLIVLSHIHKERSRFHVPAYALLIVGLCSFSAIIFLSISTFFFDWPRTYAGGGFDASPRPASTGPINASSGSGSAATDSLRAPSTPSSQDEGPRDPPSPPATLPLGLVDAPDHIAGRGGVPFRGGVSVLDHVAPASPERVPLESAIPTADQGPAPGARLINSLSGWIFVQGLEIWLSQSALLPQACPQPPVALANWGGHPNQYTLRCEPSDWMVLDLRDSIEEGLILPNHVYCFRLKDHLGGVSRIDASDLPGKLAVTHFRARAAIAFRLAAWDGYRDITLTHGDDRVGVVLPCHV